jgi:hypothetical protein
MAPGNPHRNASRLQGLHCWWVPHDSSLLALLPHRYPQLASQCREPTTTYLSEPQALGFVILLAPGGFHPHRAWRTTTPHCLWQQESPHSLVKERECQVPQWGEVSYNLPLCRWHQKPCFPKVHRRSAFHTALPCKRTTPLLSKSWNPTSSAKWQPTTLLVVGGLPPTVHRDQVLPTVTAGEHCSSHQRAGTPARSQRGKKR